MGNRQAVATGVNPYPDGDLFWDNWGLGGLIVGIILAILGILLQILEIVRIYMGLYNFGLKNDDWSDQTRYGVVNGTNGYFLYAEPWHFWPWTYPGTAIGLLIMIAGFTGIISAVRKSYTTIFSFFTFCLLCILLPIFLLIYYAIIINYYINYIPTANPGVEYWNLYNRPDAADYSYGLAATNLAISALTMIVALVGLIFACIAGKICLRQKTFADYFGNFKSYPYTTNFTTGPVLNTVF